MKNWNEVAKLQKAFCDEYEIDWEPIDKSAIVFVNDSLFTKAQPINGFRNKKVKGVASWFLWSGDDLPEDTKDYFKEMPVEQLLGKKDIVLKYLAMDQGWRFQIDDEDYEDLWFDESLLE